MHICKLRCACATCLRADERELLSEPMRGDMSVRSGALEPKKINNAR